MSDIIRKRKSVRKYEQTPLDDATLSKVREHITAIKPLHPDIRGVQLLISITHYVIM